tara:strand:+ start:547 stop:783 length:237 start_codon:yes stop_codon:yes gene_type:complete
MIKNIIKIGIKKIKRNRKFGSANIMKIIKNVSLKSIKLGRKAKWITRVPSGVSTVAGAGTRILTSIRNIVSERSSKNV